MGSGTKVRGISYHNLHGVWALQRDVSTRSTRMKTKTRIPLRSKTTHWVAQTSSLVRSHLLEHANLITRTAALPQTQAQPIRAEVLEGTYWKPFSFSGTQTYICSFVLMRLICRSAHQLCFPCCTAYGCFLAICFDCVEFRQILWQPSPTAHISGPQYIFFLLTRHPQVLQKLRVEVSELNGNHRLNPKWSSKYEISSECDQRNQLALRLYPPVPVNARTALCTTVLPTGGGPDRKSPVLIPKGSSVAYSVYTMHRRPDLYGMDAELFRPERWDEQMALSQNETDSKWGYVPFNGGPRICLGMDFALTEAAYTIVRIIQKFPTIKLPEGEPVEL
ncbi:hypothetical protein VE03_10501, partial [Pseudogymnoascus sp. 23342-1-I1]